MYGPHVTTGATLPLLGWASTERLDPRRVLPRRTEKCAPAKPAGGLWTSLLRTDGSGTAWTRWCRTEHHDRTFTTLTIIRVASTARVVVNGAL